MANNSDYVPTNKLEFQQWFDNFLAKAEANVNHYGINAETIKVLKPLNETYNNDITAEADLLTKKLAQFKKTAKDKKDAVTIVRKVAQGIKSSLEYTEEVGRDFDIIAPDNPFDPKTYKPDIKLRRVSSGVEISFTKSQTEGVHIYRRKQGETGFEFMAYDVHSPYIDTKDMEGHFVYEYYARGVIDGKEIGLKSDIGAITI